MYGIGADQDDAEHEDSDGDEATESDKEDNDGDGEEEEKEVIDLTMDQDDDEQTEAESEREDEDEDDNDEDDEEKEDPCPGYNYMIVECRVTGRKRAYFEDVPWSKANASIVSKKLCNRNTNYRWKCIYNPATCSKTFGRSYSLWVHMEAKHIVGDSSFRCDAEGCGKVFTQKSSLMTHLRGKHLAPFDDYWKWQCRVCGQSYCCPMQARRCCRDKNHNR